MSLRPKIVLILIAVVSSYAGVDYFIQRAVIARSFEGLEQEEARKDLHRVTRAIESEIHHLDATCRDWAAWDETYRFVEEPNPEYERSNLSPSTFANLGINLLYVCNQDGEVIWGDILDLDDGESLSLREFPRESLAPSHRLMLHSERQRQESQGSGVFDPTEVFISGLVITEQGPMLLSSRPILTSERQGPIRGVVILGKLLQGELLRSLKNQTEVEFATWPIEGSDLPDHVKEAFDEITASPESVIREWDDDLLRVYGTFDDTRKAPALIVCADVDRKLTGEGATAARYALLSTVAAGLVILFVFLKLIQRTVLDPIAKLTDSAVEIGRTEDFSVPLNLGRDDEIGILSREFDRMTDKLVQSRAALVDAARVAGMSEIATGVLHNVGNVLNSVNVGATLVAKRVKDSDVSDLTRLTSALDDHSDDLGSFISNDPKGKHFLPFLRELSDQLIQENKDLATEIDSLNQGIEHIKKLVNAQQAYAGKTGVYEVASLTEQLENALDISRQAQANFYENLDVVREYEDLPKMLLDKHKLMEVFVNVIQNARQALDKSSTPSPCLTFRASLVGEGTVRVEIDDNGIGIAQEDLANVFAHGFTTKESGHGFGLHSSANAATEMGGSLHAESAGPGHGATFILEIPVKMANAA